MNRKQTSFIAVTAFLALVIVIIFGWKFLDHGNFSVIKPADGIADANQRRVERNTLYLRK